MFPEEYKYDVVLVVEFVEVRDNLGQNFLLLLLLKYYVRTGTSK